MDQHTFSIDGMITRDNFHCSNLIPCPHSCSLPLHLPDSVEVVEGLIWKKDVHNHLAQLCPNTTQACLYCGDLVIRKDMKGHLLEDEKKRNEHILHLWEENEKLKEEKKEWVSRVEKLEKEKKRRQGFAVGPDLELEEKYRTMLKEETEIFAKDCNGEWAPAYIQAILPFNNVKVRFKNYSPDWDIVINTITEDYKLALDQESIPPFLQQDSGAVSVDFKLGEEVMAACLYNGGSGSQLIRGRVKARQKGQVKIEPTGEWLSRNRPDPSQWYHMMEVQPLSSWKDEESKRPASYSGRGSVHEISINRSDLLLGLLHHALRNSGSSSSSTPPTPDSP
jgi:hypothetical protein